MTASQARTPSVEETPAPAKGSPLQLHPFEIRISQALRIGVMVSATILACGLALYFVRGPEAGTASTLHALIHTRVANIGIPGIVRGSLHGHANSVIRLGVLALILTPVVRVAMTAVLFAAQRDWLFLGIVSVVFAILMVGLLGIVG